MREKFHDVFVVSEEFSVAVALAHLLAEDACLNVSMDLRGDRASRLGRAPDECSVFVVDIATSPIEGGDYDMGGKPSARSIVAIVPDGERKTLGPLLNIGVQGLVARDEPPEELRRAVHEVASGRAFVSQSVLAELLDHVVECHSYMEASPAWEMSLAPREREVVHLLTSGMTNREIAGALGISEATVKSHLGRVMTKWDARDRLQVVLRAIGHRV
ncbi:DNA-binding NarL/FixJ family response regulator [Microbacterium natoriense]|uniref:DNA-binding NarL/FixJ family response regulator n=1 Tax=Microbacterium natoriense TaxID=284570 RepID=A0AAW8EV02_9MICO|nr:response regulator transcription factor [Microbacterium natoriense]MDQ0647280.1 DNA-binding NarL/FixJ family response regulator [Microbacterium natoriense]